MNRKRASKLRVTSTSDTPLSEEAARELEALLGQMPEELPVDMEEIAREMSQNAQSTGEIADRLVTESSNAAAESSNNGTISDGAAGGIEILVKLAENGDIDPKNVDIIDVTDKFLRAIAAAPKENLRQSGKVLFHACVLLRMKAEALLSVAVLDVDPMDDFLDFDEEGAAIIYDSQHNAVARQITLHDLEKALVRKANNRQNRQRKVTLEQLIEALRDAEKIEKTRTERVPRHRIDLAGYQQVNEMDDILHLAHDEDIETTIERVDHILAEYLEYGEMMQLFKVIQLLGGRGDWVDAFLAVLFLSNAGKITLEQQEFYGPLFLIRSEVAKPDTVAM